jgi:hypothetical protein
MEVPHQLLEIRVRKDCFLLYLACRWVNEFAADTECVNRAVEWENCNLQELK